MQDIKDIEQSKYLKIPITGSFEMSPAKKRCLDVEITKRKLFETDHNLKLLSTKTSITPKPSNLYEETKISSTETNSTFINTSIETSPNVHHNKSTPTKVDELWNSIKSDYEYLIDDCAIEDSCKSTETESDFFESEPDSFSEVSFTEFIKQHKELTDWLTKARMYTDHKCQQRLSYSEKYIYEAYYDEMIMHSPRYALLKDYAHKLCIRYPGMADQVNNKLAHLNSLWTQLEGTIGNQAGLQSISNQMMVKDINQDITSLKTWLDEIESELFSYKIDTNWTEVEIEDKMVNHQKLQKAIESRSCVIRAIEKLCERIHFPDDQHFVFLKIVSNLEKRWHNIWLASLEWQFRLEDVLTPGKRQTIFPGKCDTTLNEKFGSIYNNSDIIPFSEDEYERIDPDSGLGRSLSQQSINNHANITSDMVRCCTATPVSENNIDIGYSSDLCTNLKNNNQPNRTFVEDSVKLLRDQNNSMTSAYGSYREIENFRHLVTSSPLKSDVCLITSNSSNLNENIKRLVSNSDKFVEMNFNDSLAQNLVLQKNILRKAFSESALNNQSRLLSSSSRVYRSVSEKINKIGRKRKIMKNDESMETTNCIAWDSYQDPPYDMIYDEYGDEKLADTTIQPWEFNENIVSIDGTFMPDDWSNIIVNDTDSDKEDLNDVIKKSQKQLNIIRRTLSSDCLSSLNEVEATCFTNLQCLDNILVHIDKSSDLLEASDDVKKLIAKWKELYDESINKIKILTFFKQLDSVKSIITITNNILDKTKFQSRSELEEHLKVVDSHIVEIHLKLNNFDVFENNYFYCLTSSQQKRINIYRSRLNLAYKQLIDALAALQLKLYSWKRLQDGINLLVNEISKKQQLLTNFAETLKEKDKTYDAFMLNKFETELKSLKEQIKTHENYLEELQNIMDETADIRNEDSFQSLDTLSNQISSMKMGVEIVEKTIKEKCTQTTMTDDYRQPSRFVKMLKVVPFSLLIFCGISYLLDRSITDLIDWSIGFKYSVGDRPAPI